MILLRKILFIYQGDGNVPFYYFFLRMEVIMAESIIKVENLVKSFGDHEVLKKIDFEISKGEVVCIV